MDLEQLAADAIIALIPIIGAVLVFFVKKLIPKIPRVALPIIAMGLGIGLDALLAFISGGTWNPIIGAILGGCATWLREVIDTFQQHGFNPPD